MNILTDVLSLIRRGVFAKKAELDDVLVIGKWNETPDMTGVASPIPYKSVKVIRVRDFKVAAEHCDHTNSPAIPLAGTGQVYQKTDVDEDTETCTVYFRSLKSMSSNLTLSNSADDDYVEITTEGEPNLAANVGSGSQVWKDKVGETLNFRSLVQGSNVTIAQSPNEITINALNNTYTYTSAASGNDVDLQLNGSDGSLGNVKLIAGSNITLSDSGSNEVTISSTGGGSSISLTTTGTSGAATLNSGVLNIPQYTTSFSVYDEEGGPGFTVDDGETVLMFSTPTIGAITGVPVGTPSNPNSISMSLMWSNHVSLLTQSGTSAPTMIMLLDNGVSPFTWTYVALGTYQATLSTSFTDLNKVSFEIQNKFSGNGTIPYVANIVNTTTTGFTVKTFRVDTGAAVDGVLENTALEIKIYG